MADIGSTATPDTPEDDEIPATPAEFRIRAVLLLDDFAAERERLIERLADCYRKRQR